MPVPLTLDHLRRYALARSLFKPTTLSRAIAKLGFVQFDPIRSPARAQDLTLRHRVTDYRAGDLEARYPRLAVEEDFFVNYGVLPRATQRLMHPRAERKAWSRSRRAQAGAVLEFVRERGVVHPREVDAAFDHGRTKNWFGGNSRASTQLLEGMHYRGLLRVARREGGVRLYAPSLAPNGEAPHELEVPQQAPEHEASYRAHAGEAPSPASATSPRSPRAATNAAANAPPVAASNTGPEVAPNAALDALIDVAVEKYAPLPASTLGRFVSWIVKYGAPQWTRHRAAALKRAKVRLPQATVDGVLWFWPVGENPAARRFGNDTALDDELRLLAPFDPIVWDRERFEEFWGWAYRFEAYTPAAKRVRGYYALPMLWRGHIIGWANASVSDGKLKLQTGYVTGRPPRDAAFKPALQEEHARLERFLGL